MAEYNLAGHAMQRLVHAAEAHEIFALAERAETEDIDLLWSLMFNILGT
jgi:hypothetical protein